MPSSAIACRYYASLPALLLLVAAFPRGNAAESDNPYALPEDLSAEQLVSQIEKMRQRPESIRRRPGFSEALVDAVDRILLADPDPQQLRFAVLAKLEMLHEEASAGDEEADEKIRDVLQVYAPAADEPLAESIRFFVLEQAVLDAAAAAGEDETRLLEEIAAYFAAGTPTKRDLRLASTTVRIINRLPGDATAEEAYRRFGDLFAKSQDRTLRLYGRKIATGTKPPSFVGKPFELTGKALDGAAFDWNDYRGRFVLVDFWATWCPPCRAMLPGLTETYQRYESRGFDVVGVSLDDDLAALRDYVREHQIDWVNLVDAQSSGALARRYQVSAIPKTFLVGPDGVVIAEDLNGAALNAKLEELLPAN